MSKRSFTPENYCPVCGVKYIVNGVPQRHECSKIVLGSIDSAETREGRGDHFTDRAGVEIEGTISDQIAEGFRMMCASDDSYELD